MLGESFSVDRDLVQPEAGARSKTDGQSVTQQRQRQQQPTLQQLGIALINSEKPGRQPRCVGGTLGSTEPWKQDP